MFYLQLETLTLITKDGWIFKEKKRKKKERNYSKGEKKMNEENRQGMSYLT